MAAINVLIATRVRAFFSTAFKRSNGVSQLMTIDDGNAIVNVVNALAKNTSRRITYDWVVTTLGGTPSVARVNGGGVKTCIDTCPWKLPETISKYCCGVNNYYDSTGYSVTMGPVATGRYTLTIEPFATVILPDGTVSVRNWADTVVNFGSPRIPGFITVEKVNVNTYTVQTFDATGAPSDNILNNTSLTVTGIPTFVPGGWLDSSAV